MMETLQISLKAIILISFTTLFSCNSQRGIAQPSASTLHSTDSVYINSVPVLSDTALIRKNHRGYTCFALRIDDDIGYPDFSLDCNSNGININLLQDKSEVWIYSIYTNSKEYSISVASVALQIGMTLEEIYKGNETLLRDYLNSNYPEKLSAQAFKNIPELSFNFSIPDYLRIHETDGKVLLRFEDGTLQDISVKFYLESFFD